MLTYILGRFLTFGHSDIVHKQPSLTDALSQTLFILFFSLAVSLFYPLQNFIEAALHNKTTRRQISLTKSSDGYFFLSFFSLFFLFFFFLRDRRISRDSMSLVSASLSIFIRLDLLLDL